VLEFTNLVYRILMLPLLFFQKFKILSHFLAYPFPENRVVDKYSFRIYLSPVSRVKTNINKYLQ